MAEALNERGAGSVVRWLPKVAGRVQEWQYAISSICTVHSIDFVLLL